MGGVECPPVLRDGVYRYVPGRGWERGLPGQRVRVLVFVNFLCRRSCNEVLERIVRVAGELIERGVLGLGVVVCTRFRYVCDDDEAMLLFTRYNIIASPSVVVLEDGVVRASLKGMLRIERELEEVLRGVVEGLRQSGRAAAQ